MNLPPVVAPAEWRVVLAEGKRFSNGEPVDAECVRFSLQRILGHAIIVGPFERAEAQGRRLGELAGEHRARPRRVVRAVLDLLDVVQVGQRERTDVDCRLHASIRSASGART